MASLRDYYTTAKDVLSGKVGAGKAVSSGLTTKGGLLGGNSVASKVGYASRNRGVNPLAANAGGALSSYFSSNKKERNDEPNSSDYRKVFGDGGPMSSVDNPTPSADGGRSGGKIGDVSSSGDYQRNLEKNRSRAIQEAISSSWDDADDYLDDTEDQVSKMGGYIGRLGEARNKILQANEKKFNKTKEAISGNRELVRRNQKEDLDELAQDMRKNIFGSNIALGVRGAANSSASGAVARALADVGGKNRQSVLRGYGDQLSNLKQEEQNALEYFNLQRREAYDWEERQKQQAQEEFEHNRKVLSKLKNSVPDWKKDDLEDEDGKNLEKYFERLAEINAKARSYRDTLNGWLGEMLGVASEIEGSSINIDEPAELQTPEFTDQLNLGETPEGEEEEDFYNPKNKDKKKEALKNDILRNPLALEGV